MQHLALQTDSRGVTGVLVELSKGGAARWLGSVEARTAGRSAEKVAAELKQSLSKIGASRPEVAVALGPEEARVRRLAVPPAPPEELPSIVAMQAARDAGADPEQTVADFLPPLAGEGAEEVLAVSADEATLAFWREVAAALGGKLVAATPRPLSLGALVDSTEPILVTAAAGDALDFLAIEGETPRLMRSVRVGSDTGAATGRELRRTQMTLTSELPNATVFAAQAAGEGINSIDWQAIASEIDAEGSLEGAAAAVGLIQRRRREQTPALNLADPRRPPVVETGRRRTGLLAGAAAAVLLAGVWMAYDRIARLDREIADKRAEIKAAEEDAEAFEPYRERVATIDAWRRSDVTWLDEIERLGGKLRPAKLDAEDFPVASDLRATQLTASAIIGGDQPGGRIDLTAMARTSSSSELEDRLRDDLHPVEPISTSETPTDDAYRYKYSALLRAPAEVEEPEPTEAEAEPSATEPSPDEEGAA
ncbi:hypothetical protein MalM25_16420 [Planctomycetes bacterium MalM25]|nr:hypothetical protein MalM25_16420 [Planctomycetes bacterium MalM25]